MRGSLRYSLIFAVYSASTFCAACAPAEAADRAPAAASARVVRPNGPKRRDILAPGLVLTEGRRGTAEAAPLRHAQIMPRNGRSLASSGTRRGPPGVALVGGI